jgi:hypothetical protein
VYQIKQNFGEKKVRKQTFFRIKKTIGILLAVLLTVTFTVASASSYPENGYDGYNNGYLHDYWYPGHVHIGHDDGWSGVIPPGPHAYKLAGILAEHPGLWEFVTHYPGDENRYGHFFHKLEKRGYS